MYLPDIPVSGRKNQRQVIQFGGLDRTQAANEGTLADAVGVSGRLWPCLTTREGWALERETAQGSALFAWGELVSVEGSELRYGGEVVGTVEPGAKQFAVVNTKLCIFPDKKYLDLTTKEMGELQATVVNTEGLNVTFARDSVTFTTDEVVGTISDAWLDIRPTVESVREYAKRNKECVDAAHGIQGDRTHIMLYDSVEWDKETKQWITQGGKDWSRMSDSSITPSKLIGKRVILRQTGISGGFALNKKAVSERWWVKSGTSQVQFDLEYSVTDYGTQNTDGCYGIITQAAIEDKSVDFSSEYYAYSVKLTVEIHNAEVGNRTLDGLFKPGDRVTVSGCATAGNNHETLEVKFVEGRTISFVTNEEQEPPFTAATETGKVTVCRKVPGLDFICESGNRLWGVSNQDKMIYASALGDPTNFYIYEGATAGNSVLSYAVPVGTDGDFTAICAYGSNVLCWKENCLHKVLGTMPANYEVFTYQIAGVQAGSGGSLQTVNEVLYYKGREGVYAYTGGAPQLISAKLGLVDYAEAVAGHDGRNYIISMKRTDTGDWETLNYGIETGLWMKEGNTRVTAFANLGGELYFLTEEGVFHREGEGDGDAPISWEAAFTPFHETVHNKKGYSRLLLRLELGEGAWAEVDVAQDNGPFKPVWTARQPCPPTQVIPIRPGRCDRFRVRLRGEGKFVLRSIVREFTAGSVW